MEMVKDNFSTEIYQQRIQKLKVSLDKYTKRSRLWVLIRLSTFIFLASYAYFSFPYHLYSGLVLLGTIVIFLFFIRKSVENKEQLNFIKRLITINENEIKASHFDFSNFSSGENYIDPAHSFSYDMDVFGKKGFFQILNRTVTINGEQKLVHDLLNGVQNPERKTQAIDELSTKLEWYQEYLAYGSLLEKEEIAYNVNAILQEDFQVKKWMKSLRFILPIIALVLSISVYFDGITNSLFLVGAVLTLLPTLQSLKETNKLHHFISKRERRVKAMLNQLHIFEKEKFESDLLSEYYDTLFHKSKNANKGLKELDKIVKEFLYRDNVIVGVLLNFFLAWDFRLLLNLKNWQKNYKEEVENWENILYEMEGLISGAIYRTNFQKHTCIPKITEDEKIEILDLGHPIIPLGKLIKNNFSLSPEQRYTIITGPNMAGKSTFLRSLGINLILAKAGFHTLASKFEFPDVKLYSSMRNTDSLEEETSYFHAELLRLRFIVDAIERGEKVFIILDEILKGTNSKDKQEGSARFLQKLNQLGSRGIIATHDLSLTNLAEETSRIVNKYFDTKIEGEDISFDYKIREGIAQNMNASFLLKKMNLIE